MLKEKAGGSLSCVVADVVSDQLSNNETNS